MFRRTILLSALMVVAVPVTDAHASRHFLGHSTCGSGSASCPRQHKEFTALTRGRYLYAVALPFRCTYTDGSGTGTGFAYARRIRVRESGRFRWTGRDLRIVGRLERGRLTGRITATEPGSNPPYDSNCKVHRLRFRGRYIEHALHRAGSYRGTVRCESVSARCPAQHHRVTLRVRGNHLVGFRTTLTCRTEAHATKRIRVKIGPVQLDWYGRFSADIDRSTASTNGSFDLRGAARGERVRGVLRYYEENSGGNHYCQGNTTFTASRHDSE